MMRRPIRAGVRDVRGATIIEFAIVAPVMLLLIMGFCELTYEGYVKSVLAGAMQKAGRDSTIQGNGTTAATSAIDAKVRAAMLPLAKAATFVPSRKSYAQFGTVAPEPFDDNVGNGIFDPTRDCFTDLNGNGSWDADPGITGQGGASDVVVYTMTMTYPRLFPIARMLGWPATITTSATTTLKNQPYQLQSTTTPTRICP